MQIYGPSHAHSSAGLKGPHNPLLQRNVDGPARAAGGDQVQISDAAQAASQGEIRMDLVARVRSEIASGTYETADKLDQALSRLLDEVG